MSQASHTGGERTPLDRLQQLAADRGASVRNQYARVLAGDLPVPRYALTVTCAGERDLMLGHTPGELAAMAQDRLSETPPALPQEIVDLHDGERRRAVTAVFFAVEQMTLPPVVRDLVDDDLRDRTGDLHRNGEREEELRRAREHMDAGEPVPADLFTTIGDVIELNLEDRRHDGERDEAAEELLTDIHEQLLFRIPARNYAPDAATSN